MTIYTTVDEGKRHYTEIHDMWWAEYQKDQKSPNTLRLKDYAEAIKADLLTQFGKINPQYPDCEYCLTQSVFKGGPSHVGSSYCRSGKRPHCTCDSCF